MSVFPLTVETRCGESGLSVPAGASLRYSLFYLLGLALPYVHFMFLIWVVFEIFTPIMGRSGTEIPPEVVLASLVTLATIFLSSFFVSIPTNQGVFVARWMRLCLIMIPS